MSKWRKKPVVIDAIEWTGSNLLELSREFPDLDAVYTTNDSTLAIKTLEGTMTANRGDWIIRGVNGEYYPCKPEIFEKSYENADGL